MQTGDIVIVSFPYTDLITFKARPAVVITTTKDHNDIVVSLITSKVPATIGGLQILLQPDTINNLRVPSVIKVDRIATVEKSRIAAAAGRLTHQQIEEFKKYFKSLVD